MDREMQAMVLAAPATALQRRRLPMPQPGRGQVRLRVSACAVCRTDLHVVDGELPHPKLPLVPGHEIVGARRWLRAGRRAVRDRRRGSACPGSAGPAASAATAARAARTSATGPASPATRSTAAMPSTPSPTRATASRFPTAMPTSAGGAAAVRRADRLPLAAAWRATRERLGIYGFGAAAHIVAQVARHAGTRGLRLHPPRRRGGAGSSRATLGAVWAGGSDEAPPEPLDAALIFAPVGALVPAALRAVAHGRRRSSAAAST